MSTPRRRALGGTGFTLVEVLVSTTLVILLLLILVNVTSQTGKIWKYTTGKAEQFREAREAFESMTRRLSQATLNTYWDYDNQQTPTKYLRKSELHFQSDQASAMVTGNSVAGQQATDHDHPTHAIFFLAPLGFTTKPTEYPGLGNLLNVCGYYIQYGPDPERPPFLDSLPSNISGQRNRYRLMEYVQPTEDLKIFNTDLTNLTNPAEAKKWLVDLTQSPVPNARSIAENIVALVIVPKLSLQEDADGDKLAPNYAYDSITDGPNGSNLNYNTRNQLPPEVQVTMVAIDESSALLLASLNGGAMPALMDPLWFTSGSLHSAKQYPADLQLVQQKFSAKPAINYRVFSTNVRIRGAKWSRQ